MHHASVHALTPHPRRTQHAYIYPRARRTHRAHHTPSCPSYPSPPPHTRSRSPLDLPSANSDPLMPGRGEGRRRSRRLGGSSSSSSSASSPPSSPAAADDDAADADTGMSSSSSLNGCVDLTMDANGGFDDLPDDFIAAVFFSGFIHSFDVITKVSSVSRRMMRLAGVTKDSLDLQKRGPGECKMQVSGSSEWDAGANGCRNTVLS